MDGRERYLSSFNNIDLIFCHEQKNRRKHIICDILCQFYAASLMDNVEKQLELFKSTILVCAPDLIIYHITSMLQDTQPAPTSPAPDMPTVHSKPRPPKSPDTTSPTSPAWSDSSDAGAAEETDMLALSKRYQPFEYSAVHQPQVSSTLKNPQGTLGDKHAPSLANASPPQANTPQR